MNIAFFAEPRHWAPLQNLLRWLVPAVTPLASAQQSHLNLPAGAETRPTCLRRHGRPEATPLAHPAQRRPLRVVRVMEAGQTPAQVGRMVISGRLADVCAELDRLAACEAAAR